MERSTEEYLAKIRRTVAESKRMIESVKLRFAETDRMLAESGTTREEVMKMSFTPEQREAVNFELRRRGFSALEEPEDAVAASVFAPTSYDTADNAPDMENRRRKFGAMMKGLRM